MCGDIYTMQKKHFQAEFSSKRPKLLSKAVRLSINALLRFDKRIDTVLSNRSSHDVINDKCHADYSTAALMDLVEANGHEAYWSYHDYLAAGDVPGDYSETGMFYAQNLNAGMFKYVTALDRVADCNLASAVKIYWAWAAVERNLKELLAYAQQAPDLSCYDGDIPKFCVGLQSVADRLKELGY